VISVAYGPPDQTTPNYQSVLSKQENIGKEEIPDVPRMEFRILSFEEIKEGFF